jgi:hypothetical protein
MAIRTFWILLLKILGIWLMIGGLNVIPQFLSAFSFFGDNHQDNFLSVIYIIFLLLLTVGLYLIVLKLFVFNSNWLIDKLKLDKGFNEERLDLRITQKSVLTIATIVIGGLILVDALPMLCSQIFTFIQQKAVFREDPQFSWIIFYSIKTIIGYLLMTNSKLIINYIDKKTAIVEN